MRGEVPRRLGSEGTKGGLNDEVNSKGKPASSEGRTLAREKYAPPASEGLGADEGQRCRTLGKGIQRIRQMVQTTIIRHQETITKEGWTGALKKTLEASFLFQVRKF